MKKTVFILAIAILSLTSCFREKIEGSGVVISEVRSESEFNAIETDGVFNIYITQGDIHEVIIETDDNLQAIVRVSTYNNVLNIEQEDHVNFDATKMNVYITTPDITTITSDGVVDIYSENKLYLNNLRIYHDGVGDFDLDIDCAEVRVDMDGVGNIYLAGNADYLNVKSDGVGSLNAYNLITEEVALKNSGVGNAKVYVTKKLDVTISGVGSVYYKGSPDFISTRINGEGTLRKK